MVGIVFYQKENKRWEKVGQVQESGGSGSRRRQPAPMAGHRPQRKQMPLPTAASMMTKGSFELVSPTGS